MLIAHPLAIVWKSRSTIVIRTLCLFIKITNSIIHAHLKVDAFTIYWIISRGCNHNVNNKWINRQNLATAVNYTKPIAQNWDLPVVCLGIHQFNIWHSGFESIHKLIEFMWSLVDCWVKISCGQYKLQIMRGAPNSDRFSDFKLHFYCRFKPFL